VGLSTAILTQIFVKSAKENREVYFFKGEVRSGSYFGLGLQYLKRQMVAVLGADTCGGKDPSPRWVSP
jgi:hypothetical protein